MLALLAFQDFFLPFQTFRLRFSINGFLVCFYVEVYGAELIARSAHFPTIHLTFLDSKSFSATLLSRLYKKKRQFGNSKSTLDFLFLTMCHLAFPQFGVEVKAEIKADFSPIQMFRVSKGNFISLSAFHPFFYFR